MKINATAQLSVLIYLRYLKRYGFSSSRSLYLIPILKFSIPTYPRDTFRKIRKKYENEIPIIKQIKSGVPQRSVLGPILYLISTADTATTTTSSTATFTDNTALLATSYNSVSNSIIQCHILSCNRQCQVLGNTFGQETY